MPRHQDPELFPGLRIPPRNQLDHSDHEYRRHAIVSSTLWLLPSILIGGKMLLLNTESSLDTVEKFAVGLSGALLFGAGEFLAKRSGKKLAYGLALTAAATAFLPEPVRSIDALAAAFTLSSLGYLDGGTGSKFAGSSAYLISQLVNYFRDKYIERANTSNN